MRIIQFIILILILSNIFLLVGCGSLEKSKLEGEKGDKNKLENNTGISDVFEDAEEVSPPQIPGLD